ncbi:MAG: 5-formyltetrahydrofolate cyclo-ligase [Candidatus Lambdaproteobacteria bacterium]|nr:5-formyltetrahydrofolate cyclo-ligase [Candidatus Lambdaproteobacteria bacterium]
MVSGAEIKAEITAWRKGERARLRALRARLPAAERARADAAIAARLWEEFPALRQGAVGFYWPLAGELDLRALMGRLVAAGARAALPVIVEKDKPVEFWGWQPGAAMAAGFWGIQVPALREALAPDALLIPLVGFDDGGFRLGNGGGYYDRTLAALEPRPLAIGVGYELGRLATIHPQPHDVAMDAIVTEAGTRWRAGSPHAPRPMAAASASADAAAPGFSSPACALAEAPETYTGHLPPAELIAALNELLEAEKAGAKVAAAMAGEAEGTTLRATLAELRRDEAGCVAMLARHVRALGGAPSRKVGAFREKALPIEDAAARLAFLNRGQQWVVRRLGELLPKIRQDDLHRDLRAMLELHERNIARCAQVLATLDERPR